MCMDAEPPGYCSTDYCRGLKEEKVHREANHLGAMYFAVNSALGAMSSTENLAVRRGVRANEHGSGNIEVLRQENPQGSWYHKLYDDTQYAHNEGAKYPVYCEPQQVTYADSRHSRAATLDPRKYNDWSGGVRDVGEISWHGRHYNFPKSTSSQQGSARDMSQSMAFREGYWGESNSCSDLQFVDEQPSWKEEYGYQSFRRAGGLGHTNVLPFSNIMEGGQNLNPIPFGPGGDRHMSGRPAHPNLDNRDAHQALGSIHPPHSFQDNRLDAVRLSYNSPRGNEQGLSHGDFSIPKDRHSGPSSTRDSPGLPPRAQWCNSGWSPRIGVAGSMGEPPLSSDAANVCRPVEQNKLALFHYSGSSVPPFCPHPAGLHAEQEGFLQDLPFPFAMQNPPAGLQGRDEQRISNLPQNARSSRPLACGSSSRNIRNWPKEREFLQRQVIPSHAEELFRLHNMKARMSSIEPQRNAVPHGSHPYRNPNLKVVGDETVNWDASREENSHHPQENWEAINDDLVANNVSELQADEQVSPWHREEEELGLLLRAQQAASVCSLQFLKEMSEEDDDDDDDDLIDGYEEEDDDVSLGGSVASDDDGINLQHQPQMENSDGNGKEEFKSREEKAYEYFVKVFQDNHELRKLYEEKRNCGEFECLVCVGEGAKRKRKKFPDVVGVVQHSKKITKTKKAFEHRGYARAIRYLLGWNSLGPPQFASSFGMSAPRGCIPPADSPCSLLEKSGSQEDFQDDDIRAQELSAKRAKLSADGMPETE